ncbi:MAG: orotate phosphoribosyltransferase [bacterium]
MFAWTVKTDGRFKVAAVDDRDRLLELIGELAVVHGRVTLSSGAQADYYIDLRRITLHREAAPLVGRVLRELTWDWDYQAVGGLTLGADPVATAVLHAGAGAVDAFVVRKSEKRHGMQQRIEGPSVTGRRVLIVEDVSTTGSSPLTAIEAARGEGADVIGAALIVDRGGVVAIEAAGVACRAAFSLADLGLA